MTARRRLFTVILDFRGGTYVAQVEASDAAEASRVWATNLDVKAIQGMGPAGKSTLVEVMSDPSLSPVPLDGIANVWCRHALVRGHGCLIHIVETVKRRPRSVPSARDR